jgi:type VI secretion system secreted protein VgrG
MAASDATFLFSITGNTKILSVSNVSAFESLSMPFNVQIRLVTSIAIKDYDSLMGKESLLTIINEYDASRRTDRYFHGIVKRLEYTGSDHLKYFYEVEMVPQFWQFSLRKNCRIFQETTTQKIIEELLEEGSIDSDHYRLDLINENRDRGFCVQYNESDFDFISRLLEEEGLYYYFEHFKDKHVLVICDDKAMHTPIKGAKILCVNPGGMEADEESVYSFTFSQKMQSGEYAHRNFNFKKTSLDLTANQSAPNKETFEVFEYPSLHISQERGAELAGVRSEELVAMQKQGHGETTSCRLIPGYTFTLADHDSDVLNQEYLIVSAVYAGEQPQSLEEGNGDGFSFDVEFTVIPAAVQYRPIRTKERPFVKGIQTAIVVGPKGEEINTDEFGRVRVQFHWDRVGKKDDNSSCWLRVSQSWGGGGYGSQFIPRIGDEVLVDFIEGNPDRPIVTGSVYNSDNMPINSLKKSITQSGFKTKTHKGEGFHELRFDDAKGAEEIYLHSQKDWNIVVKNNKGQTIGGDSSTNVEKSLLKTAEDITLVANSRITLVCGESIIIIDPSGISIKGGKINLNE